MTYAFLAPPLLPSLRRRSGSSHSVPLCTVPQPSPADDFALVDDSSSPIYLQTLLHGGTTPSKKPGSKSRALPDPSPSIIEDKEVTTFVDDQTPADIFVSRAVELASARSARRSSRVNRPANLFPTPSKRGRAASAAHDLPDLTEGSGTKPRAPNGIPGGPPDLLQELLPLLAKEEQEERRNRTEDENDIRARVAVAWDQSVSMHRSTARLDNLKPFRLREEAEDECDSCKGTGMTTCEYCKGEGFLDLGENAEKFDSNFKGHVLSFPKNVTGNIYHCPLCGGLQEERCIKCFGSGVNPDRKKRQEGEAQKDIGESAWQVFDFEELLKQEGDRVEIGLDGTIILRARKPKRTGRKGRKATSEKGKDTVVEAKQKDPEPKKQPQVKRKRGRPRKVPVLEVNEDGEDTGVDADLSETPTRVLVPRGRTVGRSTDFVNTTDYKVGRKLRTQASAAQQRQALSSKLDEATAAKKKRAREDE